MITEPSKETERLIVGGSLALLALMACWAIYFVPLSAGEALLYSNLACWSHPFPDFDIKSFSGCDHRFDLITPFGFKLARAWPMVGMLPSLLYAPLYYLFGSTTTLLVFGLLIFMAFSFLTSRVTHHPKMTLAVFISFFPFLFSFVHDVGPIAFDMMVFPAGAFLFRRSLHTTLPHNFLYAALLALLVFVAIEENPIFLTLLPGFTFFCLAFLGDNFAELKQLMRRSWYVVALLLVMVSFACFLILCSTFPDGRLYVSALMEGANSINMPYEAASQSATDWALSLSRFLLFWPNYAEHYFNVDLINEYGNYILTFRTFIAFALLPGLLVLTCFLALYAQPKLKRVKSVSSRAFFLFLSFLTLVLLMGMSGKMNEGSQCVFLWIPLLLLFSDLLARLSWRRQTVVVVLYFAVNLIPLLWLTQVDTLYENSSERDAVSAYFAKERDYKVVINYLSGGHHPIQALFGPTNELITTVDQPKEIRKLFEYAKLSRRSLYMVCHELDPSRAQLGYVNDICHEKILEKTLSVDIDRDVILHDVLPGLKVWHVYEVVP